jgi:hypothetical protein
MDFHVFLEELLASKSAYSRGKPVRQIIKHPVNRELSDG